MNDIFLCPSTPQRDVSVHRKATSSCNNMRETPCLKPYVNFVSGNKHYFKGVKDKIDSKCKELLEVYGHKHEKLFSFSALVFVFRVTFCF